MPRFIPLESQLRKSGLFLIAGIDEAGRGPLAGPVVSAAVILPPRIQLPGLNDSKKLSATKRMQLYHKITEKAIDYAITFVPPQTIDEHNILKATIYANSLCIKNLRQIPDIALIDGRDRQILDIPHQTIIKGDQKVRSIAAASILAKVARDSLMEHYATIYPQYGFHQHMGYGTRKHRANLHKYGFCEIHRKSYTVQQ